MLPFGLLEEEDLSSSAILNKLRVQRLFGFFNRCLALRIVRSITSSNLEIKEAVISSVDVSAFRNVGEALTEVSHSCPREETDEVLEINEEDPVVLVRVVHHLLESRGPLG